MEMKNILKGVKTVASHPAVAGAVQGALAAYMKDAGKRRSGKGMSLLVGIGIGVVVGGGLALLLGTEGGKNLRAKLMKSIATATTREAKVDDEHRPEVTKPDGVPTNTHLKKYRPGSGTEPSTS